MPGSVYSLIDMSCDHYCNCCRYISFCYLLGTVVCSGHYQDIPNRDGRWFSLKLNPKYLWEFDTLEQWVFRLFDCELWKKYTRRCIIHMYKHAHNTHTPLKRQVSWKHTYLFMYNPVWELLFHSILFYSLLLCLQNTGRDPLNGYELWPAFYRTPP